nr:MAG TPA: hypothetical protein [Caudoviricetes sp.]
MGRTRVLLLENRVIMDMRRPEREFFGPVESFEEDENDC